MMSETLDFFPQFFNDECFTSTLDFPPKNGPSTPSPTVFFGTKNADNWGYFRGLCSFPLHFLRIHTACSRWRFIYFRNRDLPWFGRGFCPWRCSCWVAVAAVGSGGMGPRKGMVSWGASCGISGKTIPFWPFFLGVWSNMKVNLVVQWLVLTHPVVVSMIYFCLLFTCKNDPFWQILFFKWVGSTRKHRAVPCAHKGFW